MDTSIRIFITLVVGALPLILAGCACSGTSDFLTVAVASKDDVYYSSTAPSWNATYTHPANQTFEASASWGKNDDAPDDNLFELYRTTSGTAKPVDLRTYECETDSPGQTLEGECSEFGGTGSCPHKGRNWVPVDGLSDGETYLLVMYPERGNGKELSWDGAREDFDGEEALTMMIEVGEPLTP